MCIDYRALNLKIVPDAQPKPRIQDILDSLGGHQQFTTLDMSKAYHQGYIDEQFCHLTVPPLQPVGHCWSGSVSRWVSETHRQRFKDTSTLCWGT